jgi:hypothetical protein
LAPVAARTGLLAGLLSVAFAVGTRVDRLALRTTLGHPTSPAAVAVGRWLAATVAASLAVTGVSVALALRDGAAPAVLLEGWSLRGQPARRPALTATRCWRRQRSAAALIAGAALLDRGARTPPFIIIRKLCGAQDRDQPACWLARERRLVGLAGVTGAPAASASRCGRAVRRPRRSGGVWQGPPGRRRGAAS